MIKNIIKYILTILSSLISVYVLCDVIILPYVFYVDETIVPDVINHNISTGQILLKDQDLNFRVQYIPSNKNDKVGNIINSIPGPNKKVKKGTVVDLKVLGEKETYIVPDLTLKSKNISYQLIVVEQTDTLPFNRGKLLNVGFLEALKKTSKLCRELKIDKKELNDGGLNSTI